MFRAADRQLQNTIEKDRRERERALDDSVARRATVDASMKESIKNAATALRQLWSVLECDAADVVRFLSAVEGKSVITFCCCFSVMEYFSVHSLTSIVLILLSCTSQK